MDQLFPAVLHICVESVMGKASCNGSQHSALPTGRQPIGHPARCWAIDSNLALRRGQGQLSSRGFITLKRGIAVKHQLSNRLYNLRSSPTCFPQSPSITRARLHKEHRFSSGPHRAGATAHHMLCAKEKGGFVKSDVVKGPRKGSQESD